MMRATGIVRRIDDLGRVVVPKEIRKTLRIREGDPLEIFTDRTGEIILKKYSPINELSEFAILFAEATYNILGESIIITDTDHVLAVTGASKKDLNEKQISRELDVIMQSKENKIIDVKANLISITIDKCDLSEYFSQAIVPIVLHGDVIGSIIIMSKNKDKILNQSDLTIAQVGGQFLAKYMET